MNIVAYCRVSTDKEDQLNSLETQKQFFEEYAKLNNHKIIRVYADEGISGTKLNKRIAFMQLMEDSKQGEFEMVVTKDISRLARNTVDFLQSIRTLKTRNIETKFITNNMSASADSEFILTLYAAMAQEESANMSKRIKFGKKANAEKGRVPNVIYGYNKIKGDYFNLEINEYEANVIQRIFNMYTMEGYGENKIAMILNSEKCYTRRGCEWAQHTVGRILRNEIYVGIIINGKQEIADYLTGERKDKDEEEWQVVERPELRLIKQEQFEEAQSILLSRKDSFKLTSKRNSTKHVLSTMIVCGDCGYSFRQVKRKIKDGYSLSWVCSGRNARGKDSCSNHIKLREADIFAELNNYLMYMETHKEQIIADVLKQFKKQYKGVKDNEKAKRVLKRDLDKLNKTKEKFMEMYTADIITLEELKEKNNELKVQIEQVTSDLNMVENNLTKCDQLEDMLNETFDNIGVATKVEEMTNLQLKKIIKEIKVSPDGTVDIYLNLLSELGLAQNVLLYADRT